LLNYSFWKGNLVKLAIEIAMANTKVKGMRSRWQKSRKVRE